MVGQRRAAQAMAAATVGVCWGSVAGVAVAMVAGKWLSATFADLTPVYMTSYYLIFLGSIAWAFYRRAARALVELLWLCALALLAIPLTDVWALLWPHPWRWAPARLETWLVDGVAMLAGTAFLYAARRAHRRAKQGSTDSVWSEQRHSDTLLTQAIN